MKRTASKAAENKEAKRQRTESPEVPAEPVARIQGDELFMDIWHAIFNQCDGMAIVPLTSVCTRFHKHIMEEDPQLRAKHKSPEGLLERVVTSDKRIGPQDKPLIKIILPAALINGVDVQRIARLLVRMKSPALCNYVMAKVAAELTTFPRRDANDIQSQLANQILVEYSALRNLEAFPTNIADFDQYLLDNQLDVWTEFPHSSFLMPLTYFFDSEILSERILESVLLKIWKAIVGDEGTFTHDAWNKIRLSFEIENPLINKFHIISSYLSTNAVQRMARKFILIATTFHNCSNHHYHELFRLFFSKALDRDTLVHDVNLKGCLEKDRRAVCDEAHDLKSLFRMAAEYGISMTNMMESIQKWLTLSSCTQILRRTINEVIQFNDQVQNSNDYSWLPDYDTNLAVELINSLGSKQKIAELLESIWTVECPKTRAVILKLASKRTDDAIQALHHFLTPLGWSFVEADSNLELLDNEPLGTLVSSLPSALTLRSLVEVFECIGKPKSILRTLAQDVELVWLHRNDEKLDCGMFHEFLSSLPQKSLARLIRFLRLHWFLQPTLHLSGQLAEFYQLFPYLDLKVDEEEIISKAAGHKIGPHRMQVSIRRFSLDQTTFDANLAKLNQK